MKVAESVKILYDHVHKKLHNQDVMLCVCVPVDHDSLPSDEVSGQVEGRETKRWRERHC